MTVPAVLFCLLMLPTVHAQMQNLMRPSSNFRWEPCFHSQQKLLTCVNSSTYRYLDCETGGFVEGSDRLCREGFECTALRPHSVLGSCRAVRNTNVRGGGGIGTHLLRSVDYQIVETVNADELNRCKANASNPTIDAIEGRMLCEVIQATEIIQPTFGHSLGNTWLTRSPATGTGSIDGCQFSSAQEWRECVGANVAKLANLLVARSPHLLFAAGLMEFLNVANLDDPTNWVQRCCVPNTVGSWGGNDTCVPNVRSSCGQDYYISWGKVYLDAGIRSFFFGQSRLTGGGRSCNSDGTGCSRVSIAGAEGFALVITALRQYADAQGYGEVYFGPQAASGFELSNGTDIADWAYGAQHLFARDEWLVQPFGVNGTAPPLGPQWYGSMDLHDANRMNNANRLPVMLDFDNFSGDEDRPDDIRRLSAWPNKTRAQFVQTLWHTMRMYNSRVTVSIPLSKAAGGNWPKFKQPQSQCWSGAWGDARGDGVYFGAISCGIVDVAKTLFEQHDQPSVAEVLDAVDHNHLGTALQSPDLTAVWGFLTLLGRDFSNTHEYSDAVKSLPDLVLGARGARGAFARSILSSPEFSKSECATNSSCVAERLETFLCLRTPECMHDVGGSAFSDVDYIDALSAAADRMSLFGNAALIDPSWCVGC